MPPPRLFDFGHFSSYLHVIETPPLLESSEYLDEKKTNNKETI